MRVSRPILVIVLAATIAHSAQLSYLASIKENISGSENAFSEYLTGGRFVANDITMRELVRLAYRIHDYQLIGAPSWFTSKRYDVNARVEDNPSPRQEAFLQALLSDRFKFAAHIEQRELPAYALVMAKSDRKPGLGLVKSDFDCDAYRASSRRPADPRSTPPCGTNTSFTSISGKAVLIPDVASILSGLLSRPVLDKTGLTGRFDVDLKFTRDQALSNLPSPGTPGAPGSPDTPRFSLRSRSSSA